MGLEVAAPPMTELRRELDRLDRTVDLDAILELSQRPHEVERYYLHSGRAFLMFHSFRGAMHMAITRATGSEDLLEQVRRVHTSMEEIDAQTVLELGCGNGYNLLALRDRYGGERRERSGGQPFEPVRLVGLELTPSNVRRAKRMIGSAANLYHSVRASAPRSPVIDLVRGDFCATPFSNGAFDLAFGVESLCHAATPTIVLSEAARVLRPGGRLVMIDAFRADHFDTAPLELQRAAVLVERSMAVPAAHNLNTWLAAASEVGLRLADEDDLTKAILPNLLRFQRMAEAFFRRRSLVRLLRSGSESYLIHNALAGLLMPYTTQAGVHTYRALTFERVPASHALTGPHAQASTPTATGSLADVQESTEFPIRIDYRRYRTHHADHRTWVDQVLDERPGREVRRVAAIMVGYFAVGLLLASLGGFPLLYLKSPAVYVFTVSVVSTTAVLNTVSRSFHRIFEQVRPIFSISDEEYHTRIDVWARRFADTRRTLRWGIITFSLYVAAVLITVLGHTTLHAIGFTALRSRLFGAGWYVRSHVVGHIAVFLWLGLLASFLMGTAVRQALLIGYFLWDLRSLPVIPLTEVVRMRLRSSVNFFMIIAIGWFVIEGIIALMFVGAIDNFFWAVMGSLFAIGIMVAVVPQLIFRHFLLNSHREMCTWALHQLHRSSTRNLVERTRLATRSGKSARAEPTPVYHLVEAIAPPSLWVYDSQDFAVLILGQGAAITAIVLQLVKLH